MARGIECVQETFLIQINVCLCVQDSFSVVDAFQLMGSNGFLFARLFMFSVRQAHQHHTASINIIITNSHNHFNVMPEGVEQ